MMLIPNIYSNSTWIWEDYFRPIRILLNAHVQILRWKYVITIMLLNLILNLCSHSAFDFRRVSYFSFFLKKKTLKIKEGEIKKGKNNENQSVDYHTHSKILASRSSDVSITWKKKKKKKLSIIHTHIEYVYLQIKVYGWYVPQFARFNTYINYVDKYVFIS